MTDDTTERGCTRRALLRAGTAGAAAAAVGATSGTALAQSSPYGGWLSNVSNFDGTTVDMSGKDSVTVAVGTQGNGGNFAFSPPAIKVDPGTTVVWEWTGKGGSHNVVDDAGNFESELVGDEGHTFTQTFEEPGVRKYFCLPHKGMGMKGVVAVGDTAKGEVINPGDSGGKTGGSSGASDGGGSKSGSSGDGGDAGGNGDGGSGESGNGDGGEDEQTAATPLAAKTLVAMLVIGFLSPLVFLLFVRRKIGQRPPET